MLPFLRYTVGGVLIVGIIFITGCGKLPRSTGERQPESKVWETAWVDPTILISDSLYTLIRSERIDSFLVDTKRSSTNARMPSIEFYVKDPSCFVAINLLDRNKAVRLPLIAKHLRRGYYKLTLSIEPDYIGPLTDDRWYLKAEYCRQTKLVQIYLR